ncbi:hypothetical protein GEMRC1_007190 [Eukaryota sp. GEM-RC1]
MNSTRLAFVKTEKRDSNVEESTFTPVINSKSKQMDRTNAVPRHEKLILEQRKREEKAEKLKKEKEEKELAGCTFKPSISKKFNSGSVNVNRRASKYSSTFDYLYSTGKKSAPRNVKPSDEKELTECTFRPNLAKVPVKNLGQNVEFKGRTQAALDSTVQRLRKAKEMREEQKRRENGLGNSSKSWAHRNREVKPFDLETEKRSNVRDLKQPLLYMDVALGGGKTGRLGIHKGDDPEELAKRFAEVYHLDEVLTHRLSLLINEQLVTLGEKESSDEGEESFESVSE